VALTDAVVISVFAVTVPREGPSKRWMGIKD